MIIKTKHALDFNALKRERKSNSLPTKPVGRPSSTHQPAKQPASISGEDMGICSLPLPREFTHEQIEKWIADDDQGYFLAGTVKLQLDSGYLPNTSRPSCRLGPSLGLGSSPRFG